MVKTILPRPRHPQRYRPCSTGRVSTYALWKLDDKTARPVRASRICPFALTNRAPPGGEGQLRGGYTHTYTREETGLLVHVNGELGGSAVDEAY